MLKCEFYQNRIEIMLRPLGVRLQLLYIKINKKNLN